MMINSAEKKTETASALMNRLVEEAERVIKGKRGFLELLVTAVAAGGHVLIEDLPGMGKTTAAKTMAALISSEGMQYPGFSRIQFTPDLLPYDITGVDVYRPESGVFEFCPGPVFAGIVLADEINRTTPKVQSALLEVMAEGQVTVGNRTHSLDPFFFVMATQNPSELEGTYYLPAAQVDRFMMRLSVGYPDPESEFDIVSGTPSERGILELEPVCTASDILDIREAAEAVYCDHRLVRAVIDAVSRTRHCADLETGISPRGPLMLVKAARAKALLEGRSYVTDQDIVDLSGAVLVHRLNSRRAGFDTEGYIRGLMLESFGRIDY